MTGGTPAQALDLGFSLILVLLIMNAMLLEAQRGILTGSEDTPNQTIRVDVAYSTADSSPRLSFQHPSKAVRHEGPFDEITPALVDICAVEQPPRVELVFSGDTPLSEVERLYRKVYGTGEIVCPVNYRADAGGGQ